jgi:hypothetical protein
MLKETMERKYKQQARNLSAQNATANNGKPLAYSSIPVAATRLKTKRRW